MAFPEELLAHGERPLLVVSPHGSEVLAPLLWLLLLLIPCAGALAGAGDSDGAAALVAMIVVIGCGTALMFALRVVHWQTTLYAITNHRVIVREGLVARDSRDIPLSVIQDVRIKQGLVARTFGAGNLELQSAAVRGHTELRWLPQVHEVRRLLHQLVQSLPSPEARVPAQADGPPPPTPPDLVGQLQRLSELRAAGHLTEEEFNLAKQRLLGGQGEAATT